jgi:photosystem II stability/assembly factor-like uncharacterized protein
MRKLVSLLLACGAVWAQDLPPALSAPVVPPAPVVLENAGKPMVAPFHCTEEDIRSAGLTCSEQDPCPVYLELAAVESTGIRIFAAGNIHTASATLYTILLGTEDNGQTWREVYERVRGAGLDHIQFADVATGWSSGLSFAPLPQDPFLLLTADGGKTWRQRAIFNEPRFGSIQQFFFEDKKSGSLVIDHGPGSASDRYELFETNDGGETWNIRETNVKAIRIKRAPVTPNADWRVRADGPSKSFHLERRQGQKWTSLAAFSVNLGACKPE